MGTYLFSRVSLVAFLLLSVCVSAQEITVSAAADLSIALAEIVAAYTKQSGQSVKLFYPALNQAVVVISESKQQAAAHKFLDFVRGTEGTSLLKNYGFSLPGESH